MKLKELITIVSCTAMLLSSSCAFAEVPEARYNDCMSKVKNYYSQAMFYEATDELNWLSEEYPEVQTDSAEFNNFCNAVNFGAENWQEIDKWFDWIESCIDAGYYLESQTQLTDLKQMYLQPMIDDVGYSSWAERWSEDWTTCEQNYYAYQQAQKEKAPAAYDSSKAKYVNNWYYYDGILLREGKGLLKDYAHGNASSLAYSAALKKAMGISDPVWIKDDDTGDYYASGISSGGWVNKGALILYVNKYTGEITKTNSVNSH